MPPESENLWNYAELLIIEHTYIYCIFTNFNKKYYIINFGNKKCKFFIKRRIKQWATKFLLQMMIQISATF